MKYIITEDQLKIAINVLSEAYLEDPYFIDNDIYHYQPTQKEIFDFNLLDKPPLYRPNKVDKTNKSVPKISVPKAKPINRKKRKYTGMAKIIIIYPGGNRVDVKNSEGPVPIVVNKLKQLKSLNNNDSKLYAIKYEFLDGDTRRYDDV